MIDQLVKIHPTVYIPDNSNVWAFATIHAGVRIGQFVSIGEHVYIGENAEIGDRTRIGQGAHITDHMIIGEGVFIGPHVVFANDKHPRVNNPTFKRESPVVEDDVSIGTCAVILPGVRLRRGCIIGAGAVVTKDVAEYATVYGVPAKEAPRAI